MALIDAIVMLNALDLSRISLGSLYDKCCFYKPEMNNCTTFKKVEWGKPSTRVCITSYPISKNEHFTAKLLYSASRIFHAAQPCILAERIELRPRAVCYYGGYTYTNNALRAS